jgi:hypothetical protein
MTTDEFTLLPKGYKDKDKDPRALVYLYPSTLNIVAYAKKLQQFSFYQALEVAEMMAKRQGFILLPFSCIHWERAKLFGEERRVKIGRKSFFMMKLTELTKKETEKLTLHLAEIQEKAY